MRLDEMGLDEMGINHSTYLRLHGGEVFSNGSFNQSKDVSER